MDIPHSVVVQVRDRVGFVSLKTLDEAISGPVHEFFGAINVKLWI